MLLYCKVGLVLWVGGGWSGPYAVLMLLSCKVGLAPHAWGPRALEAFETSTFHFETSNISKRRTFRNVEHIETSSVIGIQIA